MIDRACRRLSARAVAATLCLVSACGRADVVSEWSEHLVAALLAENVNALAQSQSAAIVHTAMFEAVNSIEGRFRSYGEPLVSLAGASAEAAAASAAHQVLIALYPNQRGRLDEALDRSMKTLSREPARRAGAVIGERAAAALLAMRRDDGADRQVAYQVTSGPGAWVPASGVPALAPHWGSVKPWALDSGSQFRAGPPPRIDSEAFKRDYLEAKQIGGKAHTTRSLEQTQIARFWTPSGVVLWSPVVAQLAKAHRLSLADSSRLFALHAMATADALVACWDTKYSHHNFRPVTAIRAGTGRADLPADADWEPALPTPPFPAYVSGHACYAGASQAVLERHFGRGELPVVTMTSPAVPGLRRHYRRIADIVAECADARVWGGMHWRTDQVAGEDLGRKVAGHVMDHRLQARR